MENRRKGNEFLMLNVMLQRKVLFIWLLLFLSSTPSIFPEEVLVSIRLILQIFLPPIPYIYISSIFILHKCCGISNMEVFVVSKSNKVNVDVP